MSTNKTSQKGLSLFVCLFVDDIRKSPCHGSGKGSRAQRVKMEWSKSLVLEGLWKCVEEEAKLMMDILRMMK